MTAYSVLRTDHLMQGVDFHDCVYPPKPDPVPLIPHNVFAPLEWVSGSGLKKVPSVMADHAPVLQRGTDIGMMIPHFCVNPLLPFIMLGSGSKTYFGAGTVKAGGTGVAVAVLGSTGINLNCGGAMGPPTPTGFVSAPSTVLAGMTLGDYCAAIFQMCADGVFQQCVGLALGQAAEVLGSGPLSIVYSNVATLLAGWLIGTPLGYSFPFALTSSLVKYGALSDAAHDRFRDYMDDPKHPTFL